MNPKWKLRKGKRIDLEYEAFVRGKPCSVPGCNRPGVVHHLGNRRNDSYSSMPLCDGIDGGHHRLSKNSYHVLGQKEFERTHNINCYEVLYELLSEYIYEG